MLPCLIVLGEPYLCRDLVVWLKLPFDCTTWEMSIAMGNCSLRELVKVDRPGVATTVKKTRQHWDLQGVGNCAGREVLQGKGWGVPRSTGTQASECSCLKCWAFEFVPPWNSTAMLFLPEDLS